MDDSHRLIGTNVDQRATEIFVVNTEAALIPMDRRFVEIHRYSALYFMPFQWPSSAHKPTEQFHGVGTVCGATSE